MSGLVHRADIVVGRSCWQVGRGGICSLEVLEEEEIGFASVSKRLAVVRRVS